MDTKMRVATMSELKDDHEWEKVVARDIAEEEELTAELRKGQWTAEEDSKLSTFVSIYGQGRWNSLARLAGLKRSGKSCRLRWLNYLRPDLRRGNFTLQEQLLILQLHFRFGNRWSKIAQHLPGRTDNEIKNYWRTKVQKLAKQLNYDSNSPQFRDALLHTWMPRLIEQLQARATSESNITHSQFSPSSEGPIPAYGFGPIDLYTKPNGSDFGCFFDASWAPTSPNWYINGPVDLHAHNDMLTDSSKAHFCTPESSGAATGNNLAYMEQSNDHLWELLLNDEANIMYLPFSWKYV